MQTTEKLKREMYRLLAAANKMAQDGISPNITLPHFESALEAYLEALRADLSESGRADHLQQRIAFLTSEVHARAEERDELRNKLQAFEFANKSAGELLRDALATVKRQREYIRTLYISRKARKGKGSTSAQSSAGNGCKAGCGGLAAIPAVNLGSKCAHSAGPDGNCIFCRGQLTQILKGVL